LPAVARRGDGFTLIEMVAVLAVIMILASLVFSVTVRQLDQIAARKEDATLARLADALTRSIQRTRSIPAASNWVAAVATELGADQTSVGVNERNNTRILWVDPRLQIGVNGGRLPYQQTAAGSVVTNGSGEIIPPVNPRLILLSSLGPPFPVTVATGDLVATDFDALWDAPPETLPAVGPWSGWGGLGRDLRVRRLHLGPLFVRLMLHNHASPGPGRYVIDGQATNIVPNTPLGVNAFFIKGTVLDLLTHTNTLDARQILARDCNFVYNLGTWRGTLFAPPPITPPVMEYLAELFYRSPRNLNAGGTPPVTPAAVLDAMEAYMTAYRNWAALGTWPKGSHPQYQAMRAAQSAMSQAALNLMNSPVEGGCGF
jgi:prepilin-type N-terminal cleavage/methylation domain-containing protein